MTDKENKTKHTYPSINKSDGKSTQRHVRRRGCESGERKEREGGVFGIAFC